VVLECGVEWEVGSFALRVRGEVIDESWFWRGK
jgi:hypothetical protein